MSRFVDSFMDACNAVDLDRVNLMLECGVSPNCRFATGSTPLHFAIARGNLELLDTLLSAGARNGPRNRDGLTALQYAEQRLGWNRTFAEKAIERIQARRLNR